MFGDFFLFIFLMYFLCETCRLTKASKRKNENGNNIYTTNDYGPLGAVRQRLTSKEQVRCALYHTVRDERTNEGLYLMTEKERIDNFVNKIDFSKTASISIAVSGFREGASGASHDKFWTKWPYRHGFLFRYYFQLTKDSDGLYTLSTTTVRTNLTLKDPYCQCCKRTVQKGRKLKGAWWIPLDQEKVNQCVNRMMEVSTDHFNYFVKEIKNAKDVPNTVYYSYCPEVTTDKYKSPYDTFMDLAYNGTTYELFTWMDAHDGEY